MLLLHTTFTNVVPDVVDVNWNGCVCADPVFLHEGDEVRLGEVVRRCRLPLSQPDVFDFQVVTCTKVGNGVGAVSYTHLTLPTKRIV